jgi:hypothetical protein
MAAYFTSESLKDEADDFFGNNDDDDAGDTENAYKTDYLHGELYIRENAAIERQQWTVGYHETYSESHEESLQGGFEAGYRDTYEVATRIGQLLGRSAAATIPSEATVPSNPHATQQFDRLAEVISAQQPDVEGGYDLAAAAHRVREVLLTITRGKDQEAISNTAANFDSLTEMNITASSELDSIKQKHQQDKSDLEELSQEVEAMFRIDSKSLDVERRI